MRFGLATTLMGDGYHAYDLHTRWRGQRWWYKEYDAPLGYPRAAARRQPDGSWRREFDGGTVVVNPTPIDLVVTFAVCVGLCGLAVGIGARLPLFGERNPARIANGFGGTVNLIASVCLVVVVLAGMGFVAVRNRADDALATIDATTFCICGAVVLVAVITGLVTMLIGADHLNKLEV